MDDPLPAGPAGADRSRADHTRTDPPGPDPSGAGLPAPGPSGADLFWAVHDGLPRQAPGSAATVRLLLGIAGPLPARARVVDIGCGTGPASLQLAREHEADVVAVDTHAPFLARLRADAAAERLRVRPLRASMSELPLADGCADLLWAEGSAYIMGVDAALVAWRRLVTPGGVLVLTDATWTTPRPAAGARAFWDAAYPQIRTPDVRIAAAQRAGWTLLGTYLLPGSDWDAYYAPLAARIAQVRARSPDAGPVLDEIGREITVRRAHGDDYGYTAFVLRRR